MVLSAQLCMCARAMLWRHAWNRRCDQPRTVSLGASVRILACCVCARGGRTAEGIASHSLLPCRTRASRSLGASQPGLVAGLGSPAVPGLAGVGATASMTSARSGPACPVHLDKLRLTGA